MTESVTRIVDAVRPLGGGGVRSWVEPLARFGLAAKGIVYVAVGSVAARAALTGRGRASGSEAALGELLRQPMGTIVLILVGVGLLGYVLWRTVEAILDPERRGEGWKGLVWRAGGLGSALVHGALALSALLMAAGEGVPRRGTDADAGRGATAWLLAQPWGVWVVGLIGVGIIVYGAREIVGAVRAWFLGDLRQEQMSLRERTWARRLGRVGTSARGAVFVLIGAFVVRAAEAVDPDRVQGFAGAFGALARSTWGPWVLAATGIGFVAYGVYMAVEARYRRIAPP